MKVKNVWAGFYENQGFRMLEIFCQPNAIAHSNRKPARTFGL